MDMEITFKTATIDDCEALCEIHISSIRELCREHHSDAEIEVWTKGRTPERYKSHIINQNVFIAQHKNTAVGFSTFNIKTGEIIQLYVHPEYAGKGVGSRILVNILNIAEKADLNEIHCNSSLNAEKFYLKAGFKAEEKCINFINGGEVTCVPMRKSLK